MAKRGLPSAPELVGRSAELAELAGLVNAACTGQAGTVIVTGDAGVGKTALVASACAAADPSTLILTGAALPMRAAGVPYLALRSALRRIGSVHGPVPLLEGTSQADVPLLIDDWLSEVARAQPVVLTIDDLHWADRGTLDVLLYLMGGPADRRLAVIATTRVRELGESHQLHQWMAIAQRFPTVSTLPLGPLDRPSTEALLAQLLGAPPSQSLVSDVFAHSAGNPYFTALLAHGVTARDHQLSTGFPADLRGAVLSAWRALPPQCQLLTRIQAVGGRYVRPEALRAVAAEALEPRAVASWLALASDAGILDLDPDGNYWFHHPLIAEMLEAGMPDDERRHWHAEFAAAYEGRAGDGPGVGLLIPVADHHFLAGHVAEGYHWSLRAATSAEASKAPADRLRLLHRAAQLRESVPEASETPRSLWSLVQRAAYSTGDVVVELEAIERQLEGIDPNQEPLAAADLMVHRAQATWWSGAAQTSTAVAAEAVRLTTPHPDSREHALAAAALAGAAAWEDRADVSSLAEEAVRAAHRSRDHHAMAAALCSASQAAFRAGLRDTAMQKATAALAEAKAAGDYRAFFWGVVWLANGQETTYISRDFADTLRWGRGELARLDAPHLYLSTVAAHEASSYLAVGNWRLAAAALRTAVSMDPGPMGEATGLVQSARLAALQGRGADALALLHQYDELFPRHAAYTGHSFAIRAEVYALAGRPQESFSVAMTGAARPAMVPQGCEWLIPLAARALADQVRDARDRARPTDALIRQVDELEGHFPAVLHDPGQLTDHFRTVVAAFQAWYTAELGRARFRPENGTEWCDAADACSEASLLWEEAYACQRAAEALLLRGHAGQARGAEFLRRGLALAEDLQALPVQAALERLAAQTRIPTGTVRGTAGHAPSPIDGLTNRERTVLDYIVTGRTYSEIARDLVISEKTVSTHVSHLLRKSGAANRFDLARWAVRWEDARRRHPPQR